MVQTIVIEELNLEDKVQVTAGIVEGYSQYKENYSDPTMWEEYVEGINKSLDNPNIEKVLVAKEEQNILGSLQLYLNSEAAYGKPELNIDAPIIRLLVVSPQARGKGIAQSLINKALDFARKIDAEYLYLHTTDMMATAVKLYERLGFERNTERDFQNRNHLVKCYRFKL